MIKQLRHLGRIISQEREHIKTLKKRIADIHNEVAEMKRQGRKEQQNHEKTVKNLNIEIKNLEKTIEQKEKEFDGQMAKKMSSLEEEIDSSTKREQFLIDKIDKIEIENKKLKAQVDDLNEENSFYKSSGQDSKMLSAKIDALKSENRKLQAQVDDLSEANSFYKTSGKDSQDSQMLSAKNREINRLKEEVKYLSIDIEAKEKEVENLRNKLMSKGGKVQDCSLLETQQVETLEAELAEKDREIDKLYEQLVNSESSMQLSESEQLKRKDQEIAKLKSLISEALLAIQMNDTSDFISSLKGSDPEIIIERKIQMPVDGVSSDPQLQELQDLLKERDEEIDYLKNVINSTLDKVKKIDPTQ